MKTLQIEIPEGYEVESFDWKTGKVCLQQKKHIIERIKTMDDVFLELKIDPDKFYNDCKGLGLTYDEFAYRQLKMVTKVLNEELESDFADNYHYKYFPYFETKPIFKHKGVGYAAYSVISFNKGLYFKNEKLAAYAAKQFYELYIDFLGVKD